MGGVAVWIQGSAIVDGSSVSGFGESAIEHDEVLGVLPADLCRRHPVDGDRKQTLFHTILGSYLTGRHAMNVSEMWGVAFQHHPITRA